MIKFDYADLYAQMGRKHYSINKLAKAIGTTQTTLQRRFNGYPFDQEEITSICKVLNIADRDIYKYFFTVKVQKTEQRA